MLAVSPRPPLYRHARRLYNECGPYQIRAILNAYGKDALVETLYFMPLMRKFDWSLPFLVPSIVRRYGLSARCQFWPRGYFVRNVLRNLEENRPVVFVLYSILGNRGLHWISVWGYDTAGDEFLCYDSQAPEREGADSIGNVRYAAPLLRSRLPWRGTFAVTIP